MGMGIASLGIDFRLDILGMTFLVAWANPVSQTDAELIKVSLLEKRPDLGVVELLSSQAIDTIPIDVEQVFIPWSNYSRSIPFWFWVGWQRGNSLYFSYAPKTAPLQMSFGDGVSTVVNPAITTSNGDVVVAMLTQDAKEGLLLRVARFTPSVMFSTPLLKNKPTASVSWLRTWKLDFVPIAARSFLAPEKFRSARKVALIESQSGGVGVCLYDIDSKTGDPRALTVPKIYAIPGSEPGAYVDDKGVSHVSFVASASADLKQLVIVDTHFPAQPSDKSTSEVQRLRAIADVPTHAAVAFQARADRPMRRDWVVAMRDGTLIHESQERAMRTDRPVVLPLNVVRMSQATYVLTADKTGPWLEMLR